MRRLLGPSVALEGMETAWPVRGREQAAVEWGAPGEGPIWVLLHGFLDHAGSWEPVARALPGWRVALDQRGHGRSPWTEGYSGYFFPEYVADLDAVVRAIVAATGRRVRLVGHSMGGTVGSLYAGARPDAVEALVSVDGLGLHDGGEEAGDRLVGFLDGAAHPPRHRPFPDLDAAAARLRKSWPFVDEAWSLRLAERATREVPGGLVWSWDPRHRTRGAIPYRHAHHLPLLRRVRCPVLAVRPELSPFRDEDVQALLAGLSSVEEARISGVGHMVPLQAPGVLATLLRAFGARIEGGAPGGAP